MERLLTEHEAFVRLGSFGLVLALMAVWESLAPRRARIVPRAVHWLNNLGLVAVNTVILRLVFPAAAVGAALVASDKSWGLFHSLAWPSALEFVLAIVLLDLAIYAQHVAVHHVPVLWRFHRMHHADVDLDVTSGARFHPLEIVFSMILKIGVVWLLGASPAAVVAFEVVLNGTAMFNHSNVRLPKALDRALRLVLVTPDMHRVHHSVHRDETDSNFGFNLPWWDRLFRTYRAQPRDGHAGMTLGLPNFRAPRHSVALPGMLMIPFRQDSAVDDNGPSAVETAPHENKP